MTDAPRPTARNVPEGRTGRACICGRILHSDGAERHVWALQPGKTPADDRYVRIDLQVRDCVCRRNLAGRTA